MELNCPCCGSKLQVDLQPVSNLSNLGTPGKPAKSEYAQVRPSAPRPFIAPKPTVATPLPKVKPLFRANTDTGKFRQALYDAGFQQTAINGTVYNDPRVGGNRLKLYFARSVADANTQQMDELNNQLLKQFGDRLLMARIHNSDTFRGTVTSYSIYLAK